MLELHTPVRLPDGYNSILKIDEVFFLKTSQFGQDAVRFLWAVEGDRHELCYALSQFLDAHRKI